MDDAYEIETGLTDEQLLALAQSPGPVSILEAARDQVSASELVEGDFKVGPIKVQVVDREGGYEGGGEYMHAIFELTHNGEVLGHVKMTGYYCSWNGSEWYPDLVRVYPHRVEVTVYKDTQ